MESSDSKALLAESKAAVNVSAVRDNFSMSHVEGCDVNLYETRAKKDIACPEGEALAFQVALQVAGHGAGTEQSAKAISRLETLHESMNLDRLHG